MTKYVDGAQLIFDMIPLLLSLQYGIGYGNYNFIATQILKVSDTFSHSTGTCSSLAVQRDYSVSMQMAVHSFVGAGASMSYV